MAEKINYPEKTNNPSDPDSIRKYFATEANEVKEVVNSLSFDIEELQSRIQHQENPFYGFWPSLSLLQAAYPVGEENAFAVIDQGLGTTPQIAKWNTTSSAWEIVGGYSDKVFVPNFQSLPAPGVEGILYITQDKTNLYFWYNDKYNLVGEAEFLKKSEYNNQVIIIPEGQFAIWKNNGNEDTTTLEPGDYGKGVVAGKVIEGTYLGGDTAEESSWQQAKKVKIQIAGNEFSYLPVLGNDGSNLQTGDIAYMGWISQNQIGRLLSFIGTPGTGLNDSTFADWDIIEQI